MDVDWQDCFYKSGDSFIDCGRNYYSWKGELFNVYAYPPPPYSGYSSNTGTRGGQAQPGGRKYYSWKSDANFMCMGPIYYGSDIQYNYDQTTNKTLGVRVVVRMKSWVRCGAVDELGRMTII